MADVRLSKVNKFHGAAQALHDISLTIADGEFAVFVGPSGCGKSTLLRSIAGLGPIRGGTVSIGWRAVSNVPPLGLRCGDGVPILCFVSAYDGAPEYGFRDEGE